MTTQNTSSPLTAVEQDIRDASEIASLEAQVEHLTMRLKDAKARIAERHPDKGDYEAGDFKIRVTVTNTLDAKKITKVFPPETFGDTIYKRAVDTERFKAHMLVAGRDIAEFQKQSAPSVKVL